VKRRLLRLVTVLTTAAGLATSLTQVASADPNVQRVDGPDCWSRSDFFKVHTPQAPHGQICFAGGGTPGGIAVQIWDVAQIDAGANTADITADGRNVHLHPNEWMYQSSGPMFISYIHLG
jgi:hypothetical protein